MARNQEGRDVDDARLHYVVPEDQLDVGDRALIEVKGREVAVFNVNGDFYAVGSHCPHMGGPCAEGLLTGFFGVGDDGKMTYSQDNEVICCPWHGWEFEITTGEHLGGSKKRLLTYDITLKDGDIYVVL